jgi:hypothetical protein
MLQRSSPMPLRVDLVLAACCKAFCCIRALPGLPLTSHMSLDELRPCCPGGKFVRNKTLALNLPLHIIHRRRAPAQHPIAPVRDMARFPFLASPPSIAFSPLVALFVCSLAAISSLSTSDPHMRTAAAGVGTVSALVAAGLLMHGTALSVEFPAPTAAARKLEPINKADCLDDFAIAEKDVVSWEKIAQLSGQTLVGVPARQ